MLGAHPTSSHALCIIVIWPDCGFNRLESSSVILYMQSRNVSEAGTQPFVLSEFKITFFVVIASSTNTLVLLQRHSCHRCT